MMIRKKMALIGFLLLGIFLLSACGPVSGANPPAPPPTASPAIVYDENELLSMIAAQLNPSLRDFNITPLLMDESFLIVDWGSHSGFDWSTGDAIIRLQRDLLPEDTNATIILEINPTEWLGTNLADIFPDASSFYFSKGWGADGDQVGVLIIGRRVDGSYYWRGVVIAEEQQQTVIPHLPEDTALAAFNEALALALVSPNYEALMNTMGDQFLIAAWQDGSSTHSPAAARDRLEKELIGKRTITVGTPAQEITTLLGGSDPQTIWDPEIKIVDLLYSVGWGDGTGEALLLIAQSGDGAYYWYGLVIADNGF